MGSMTMERTRTQTGTGTDRRRRRGLVRMTRVQERSISRRGKHPANRRNWINVRRRLAIYLRDGMACVYCGSGIEDGIKMTLDHVIPLEQEWSE